MTGIRKRFVSPVTVPLTFVPELLEARRLMSVGAVDPSFGHGGTASYDLPSLGLGYGYNTEVTSTAYYKGKVIVGGRYSLDNLNLNLNQGFILRLNADGSLDSSFGNKGVFRGFTPIAELAVNSAGQVIAAGGNTVFRLNSNGRYDSAFGTGKNGRTVLSNESASNLVLMKDGRIVIGGYDAAHPGLLLARLKPDGRFDTTFNGAGRRVYPNAPSSLYTDLAVQRDGKIDQATYVPSVIRDPMYYFSPAVMRFNANGSVDTSFGDKGTVAFTDFDSSLEYIAGPLAIRPDGKILFGTQISEDSITVNVLNADGTSFASDGIGGDLYTVDFTQLLPLPDNRYIAVGSATVWASYPRFFAIFDADGTLDHTLGDGDGYIHTVDGTTAVLGADGDILVAGQYGVTARQTKSPHSSPAVYLHFNYDSNEIMIEGSTGDDTITVTGIGNRNTGSIKVVADGKTFVFARSTVNAIKIEGGDGNDTIKVSHLELSTTLNGGSGDDLLVGSDGSDWLVGGNGRDRLYGMGGDDYLWGRDGFVDYLDGGLGNDTAFKDPSDATYSVERAE